MKFRLEITESAAADLDEIDGEEDVVRILRFFHGSENYADKML